MQLKNLLTNSKEKKLERYRKELDKKRVPVVVMHAAKGKEVVMTKDSCDTLLQVWCYHSPVSSVVTIISFIVYVLFTLSNLRCVYMATCADDGGAEVSR